MERLSDVLALDGTTHGTLVNLEGFARRNPDHPLAGDLLGAWGAYEDSGFQNSDYANGAIERAHEWAEANEGTETA